LIARRQVVVATGNAGKLREFRGMLHPLGWQLVGLEEYPEVEPAVEDGATFRANAIKKAEAVAAQLGCWTLADDSGLRVDALDGAPGVRSARFAGEPCDDAANNRKLLDGMRDVPDADRGARFVCALALARPGEPTLTVRGVLEGRIGRVPRGSGGFGYDVLFHPQGEDVTTAEMKLEDKALISHRGRALRALIAALEAEPGPGADSQLQ
jgi:XTP/dITP diphosphohydrolase